MYFPADSSDSLDYKETPTHVEMSSSHFGGECPHPGSLAEESESALMDDVDSDSSETDSTDSDLDSSETEPEMDEEMTILSGLVSIKLLTWYSYLNTMVWLYEARLLELRLYVRSEGMARIINCRIRMGL